MPPSLRMVTHVNTSEARAHATQHTNKQNVKLLREKIREEGARKAPRRERERLTQKYIE